MATRQQLETALRNADKAGDTAAARQLAQALRSGQYDQPQQETQEQPAFQPMEQEGEAQDQSMLSRVGQAVSGAVSGIGEMVSGEERTGRDIERTPSLFQSDFLSDLPATDKAKIVGLAQITPDQNELAQIIAEQVPDTEVQYNRDEQGNVYPVLRRPDGRVAMIDKPGVDLLNAAQFASDMAMFTPAGRAGTLARGVSGATATEAARQGVQAQAGGEADLTDVALAGGVEGAGRLVASGLGAAYRGAFGQPADEVQDVIEAGRQFDVPVMTTDVVPPRTIAGRAARMTAENVPVVGTGGMRASQQEARVRAVDDFIDRYQGGSYEQIVQSLKDQRSRIKTAAGKTYDNVIPKLNQAIQEGDGLRFSRGLRAIENARERLTQPGRVTSDKALDLLAQIQDSVQVSDQSFGTLKSNLSAWQEALDAVDPAMRDQLPTEDKAVIRSVLSALRKDRDDFAESVLSANEFRQLKNADQAYGEMANTLKNTRIKSILNKGDMTPEVARNMLFSNKPSEIRQIYGALTDEGRANARATIISDIARRLGDSASGITPDKLATELSKRRELLDVFFRGPRRKELNGFLRLMNATQEATRATIAQTVPTGQQLVPLALGAGAYMEPTGAAALASIGAIGRVYESPKVRSILARMASADPGSTQFEQLLNQYRQEVSRVAQAIRSEESEQ